MKINIAWCCLLLLLFAKQGATLQIGHVALKQQTNISQSEQIDTQSKDGIIITAWRELDSSKEVSFEQIKKLYCKYRKDRDPKIKAINNYYMVWKIGKQYLADKGETPIPSSLLKLIPEIDINNVRVPKDLTLESLVDSYFMLVALGDGASFDEARDGTGFSTSLPGKNLNGYDVLKLKAIFQSSNETLHQAYLSRLKMLFANGGLTLELETVYQDIKENVKDLPIKQEILTLYQSYAKLKEGEKTPDPELFDSDGKILQFSDFPGKVVVVDVWATWCCSCIDKMPDFIALKESYSERNDIIFMTVSIDRSTDRNKWLTAIKDNKMEDLLNLIAPISESKFQAEFMAWSVPRYFIFDKEGSIVNVFAASPGKEMRQQIEATLNKTY